MGEFMIKKFTLLILKHTIHQQKFALSVLNKEEKTRKIISLSVLKS